MNDLNYKQEAIYLVKSLADLSLKIEQLQEDIHAVLAHGEELAIADELEVVDSGLPD